MEANVKSLHARHETLKKLEANTRSRLKRLGVDVPNECKFNNTPPPFSVANDGDDILLGLDENPLLLTRRGARMLMDSVCDALGNQKFEHPVVRARFAAYSHEEGSAGE